MVSAILLVPGHEDHGIAVGGTTLTTPGARCIPARRQFAETSPSIRVLEWAAMGSSGALTIPAFQIETTKRPLAGFVRADDGTRTHDLLHGNPIRAATRCSRTHSNARFQGEHSAATSSHCIETRLRASKRLQNACSSIAEPGGRTLRPFSTATRERTRSEG